MINVLIPNVGRRGYLIDYMKDTPYFTGKVFVSDCDKTASGLYGNNDGFFILSKPVDNEEKYVDELINVCKTNQINLIIPVIDPEIYILSKYINIFEKNGITALVSDRQVLDICYNKLNMNQFLAEHGFWVPQTYTDIEVFKKALLQEKITFPVICKPIYGSGSEKTQVINNMRRLEADFCEGLLIQEYFADAVEYGVDIFNTFEKEPVRCIIKRKVSMRSGETDKSYTVKNAEITSLMLQLAKTLGHVGNLDCDIMAEHGRYYIIDLNPRFGGGYPATHMVGVNLLELVLRMMNGEKVLPDFNSYEEHILVMKTISVVKTTWEI